NAATGALVYITTSGGSPQSAYVKTDGSWSIPLAQMRTQDLSSIYTLDDGTNLNIQIVGNSTSEVLNFSAAVSQLSPLETVQFGAAVPDFGANQAQAQPTPPPDTSDTTIGQEPAPLGEEPTGGFNNLLTDEDRFSTQQIEDV